LAGRNGKTKPDTEPSVRLDKWLWAARLCKSRSLAAALIESGHMRVNGVRTTRPGRDISAGDVLTFPLGVGIRVVRILAVGNRRGPASEARLLYVDLGEAKGEAATATPLE